MQMPLWLEHSCLLQAMELFDNGGAIKQLIDYFKESL